MTITIPSNRTLAISAGAIIILAALGYLAFVVKPFNGQETITKKPIMAAPQPISSCGILEEKYCNQGKLLEISGVNSQTFYAVGFNLPENTPIYAPIQGVLTAKEESNSSTSYKGFSATILDRSKPEMLALSMLGALVFNSMDEETISIGQKILSIGGTEDKNYGFNFIILVGNPAPGFTPDQTPEAILKSMFPQAFEKEAETVN